VDKGTSGEIKTTADEDSATVVVPGPVGVWVIDQAG
jgi:hypothetical protein